MNSPELNEDLMKECDLPCGCYRHNRLLSGYDVMHEVRCDEHENLKWEKIVRLARDWKPRTL